MNERDKELMNQAWRQNPGWFPGYVSVQTLIDLTRADEREACAVIAETKIWAGGIVAKAIRARGNT